MQPALGSCTLSMEELSRDGAGAVLAGLLPAPGEAQPELLVCWGSLSLHPVDP